MIWWPGAKHVNLTLKSFSGFKSKFFAWCIFLSKSDQHAIPLLIDDGVLLLKFSYYELLANLMFEIRHTNAPSNIQDLFQDISDIHSYNTWSSASNNFYTQSSRLSIQVNSFSRTGTEIWNEMPACNFKKSFIYFFRSLITFSCIYFLKTWPTQISIAACGHVTILWYFNLKIQIRCGYISH